MNAHQTTAGTLTPAIRKNLPNRILRAVDNALHIGALPRALRPTLAEIARFVPQDRPFEPIFPKKESIALRIHASVATVFRHLKALKTLGLIETLEQERKSRNGRFAVSRIRLTHTGARLLGLVKMPEDVCGEAVAGDAAEILAVELEAPCTTPISEPLVAASQQVIHTPPHGILPHRHTLTKPTISKPQLPQRTENGLPIDLAHLTGQGLSRAGIFKLMGLCKANGNKRLSDMVTVANDRIRGIKGGQLFAYLKKLATGATCFVAAAATERARIRAVEEQSMMDRKIAVFKARFSEVWLSSRDQKQLIKIDRECRHAQVITEGKPSGSMPLDSNIRFLIDEMESGRLVMATLATERRLAAF